MNKAAKATGAITIIRCSYCEAETPEFTSASKAREWAYANGWVRVLRFFLCPKCARVLNILQQKSGKVIYHPEK